MESDLTIVGQVQVNSVFDLQEEGRTWFGLNGVIQAVISQIKHRTRQNPT